MSHRHDVFTHLAKTISVLPNAPSDVGNIIGANQPDNPPDDFWIRILVKDTPEKPQVIGNGFYRADGFATIDLFYPARAPFMGEEVAEEFAQSISDAIMQTTVVEGDTKIEYNGFRNPGGISEPSYFHVPLTVNFILHRSS